MEKKKEINISGCLKIKRKRFWADRYAEIQNNVFFYFKNKGDINARGVIQLKGSVVQEKSEKSNEKIIVIINPNSGDKQSETIQLKIDNESEHKEWLKHLVASSKVGLNPFTEFIDNPPSNPMGNSFKNKDLFSKSSISIMDTMVTEKNFDNANQMINNSTTLIDSEFLKKNGGENINKLKTNVNNFIMEKTDDFILFENHSNMRVFYKRIRTNKTFFSELSQISVQISKILNGVKTLQQNLGNFNFYIFLGIASMIFFLTFYLILEVTNNYSFFLSLAFTMNILLFPIIYTKIAKHDIRNILHDEKLFSEKYLESAEFKIKAIMPLAININDALCIITNHSQRKLWHPNVSSLSESNVQDEKVIKVAYKLNGNVVFQEKFIQSIYKEKEFIYVVEHLNFSILRVFLIKLNKKSNYHLLKYYSVVNSLSFESMNPAYTPLLLNGLTNFYNELRIETNSFLQDYYKRNKYLLTDDEDEEDDKEERKTEEIPTGRLSKQTTFDESKKSSNGGILTKMSSNVASPDSSKIRESVSPSKAKKPNVPESYKSYYAPVEKVFEILLNSYELTDSNGWALIDTKDGCTIHTKTDPETKLTISRGETMIEKDQDTIRICIDNLEKKSDYDGMFAEGRFLERPCEGFSISYQKFKGVFPVGPRDFVLAGAYITTEKNLMLMGAVSIEHPDHPPVKGVTRGHLYYGGWILEKVSENKTKTIFMNLSDPKGSIPKKILDYAARNQALCAAGVRKKLEKN